MIGEWLEYTPARYQKYLLTYNNMNKLKQKLQKKSNSKYYEDLDKASDELILDEMNEMNEMNDMLEALNKSQLIEIIKMIAKMKSTNNMQSLNTILSGPSYNINLHKYAHILDQFDNIILDLLKISDVNNELGKKQVDKAYIEILFLINELTTVVIKNNLFFDRYLKQKLYDYYNILQLYGIHHLLEKILDKWYGT